MAVTRDNQVLTRRVDGCEQSESFVGAWIALANTWIAGQDVVATGISTPKGIVVEPKDGHDPGRNTTQSIW
jgi:hypothetical protein